MISLVFLIICFMLVFSNALFYTFSLLLVSLVLLMWIVSSNMLSVLMLLLILIVYVGAMIILIGYICAVCPNLILSPSYNYLFSVFFLFIIFFILYPSNLSSLESSKSGILLNYFFSTWGIFTFSLITLMLFFTLLIVTSQYVSPQGPFRSTH